MNRDDLKFRVYDTQEQRYLCEDSAAYLDNYGRLVEYGNYIEEAYPGRYIVERCTGLHDVAGELIYKDDVVVVPRGDELVEYIVRWRKSMWCLYRWPHDYKPLDDFDYHQNGVRQRVEGPFRQCRIVGNIHDKEKNEQG